MKQHFFTVALCLALLCAVNTHAQPYFTDPTSFDAGADEPNCVFSADFDGDEHVDLAVATHGNGFSVLFNDGSGWFGAPALYPSLGGTWCVFGNDFNSDGYCDLVVTNTASHYNNVYLNAGDGSGRLEYLCYLNLRDPLSGFAEDLNGDYLPDVVLADNTDDPIATYYNQGNSTFSDSVLWEVGGDPTCVIGADFDGDDDCDIAATCMSEDCLSILINTGGGFRSPAKYSCEGMDSATAVCSGDFNGDTYLDVAVCSRATDTVTVFLNDGSGIFACDAQYLVGSEPRSICAADLDLDGHQDIATANYGSNSISILTNRGDGSFETSIEKSAGGEGPVSIIDTLLNNDDKPDIVVANRITGSVCVLLNITKTCNNKGDVDHNGQVDILDIDYYVDWLFRGGPPPKYEAEADLDGSGQDNILDIDYFIDWLYREGPGPIPCP